MHQGADALAWLAVIGVYYWVYRYRWFDVPSSLWGIVALVIAQDLFYYWFHRASHRIRWMWASHVTHHSSERLNLSPAFRQSNVGSTLCRDNRCQPVSNTEVRGT